MNGMQPPILLHSVHKTEIFLIPTNFHGITQDVHWNYKCINLVLEYLRTVIPKMNTICLRIVLASLLSVTAFEVERCKSPQYLDIGNAGVVSCLFQEGIVNIAWYNSTNFITDQAIVEYKNSRKGGKGIESGEFDIDSNGSLIINNVSLQHEHVFTVLTLGSSATDYYLYNISVIVIVRPDDSYPIITNCTNRNRVCFKKVFADLKCYVRNVRPAVILRWKVRTSEGDKFIPHTFDKTRYGLSYTSTATTNISHLYTDMFLLLVCKADDPQNFLTHNESTVLLQTYSGDIGSITKIPLFLKIHSNVQLTCVESKFNLIVWKYKRFTDLNFSEIVYGTYFKVNYTVHLTDEYHMRRGSTLEIPWVKIEHEGTYGCFYSNDTDEDVVVYDVMIYVPPVPPYVVVDGCNPNHYCALDVNRTGILHCRVKGIYPKITLTWKSSRADSLKNIEFFDQETNLEYNKDGTFDVSERVQYSVQDLSITKLTVHCGVSATKIKEFQMTTKLDLVFKGKSYENNGTYLTEQFWFQVLVTSFCVLTVLGALCAAILCFVKWRRRQTTETHNQDNEEVHLLIKNKRLDPLKNQLFEQLRIKYEDICASFCTIPSKDARTYHVKDIFVDCGLDLMSDDEKFIRLHSSVDIFHHELITHNRYIIEGEEGYGKTTLSLYFAYRWCENLKKTIEKERKLFILLLVNQIGELTSIYSAIKEHLLPKDSDLMEDDIKCICENSSSVVILLDGFDRYAEDRNSSISFITDIMNRDFHQAHDVILTTTPSYLPHRYASNTHRLRLPGFQDETQERYVKKITGDETTLLGQNGNLLTYFPHEFSQVPRLFVMVVHISIEEGHMKTYRSVTSLFRHIIFHLQSYSKKGTKRSHAEEHMTKHESLNNLAFKSLFEKLEKPRWKKKMLLERLGEEMYNHYIDAGILVEDKYAHVPNEEGSPISCSKKSNVRFFHEIFGEWYAAQFLATRFEETRGNSNSNNRNKINDLLEKVLKDNPSYLFWTLLFACGLNKSFLEILTESLKNIHGGDRYEILCEIEKTGLIEDSRNSVEQFCDGTVTIAKIYDSFMQKVIIRILDIASKQNIPIHSLRLSNCLKSVKPDLRQLVLVSTPILPVLHTLQSLEIADDAKRIETDVLSLLQYCFYCGSIQILRFSRCLMPFSVSVEKLKSLKTKNKHFQVLWQTNLNLTLELDVKTGVWYTGDDDKLQKQVYDEEAKVFGTPVSELD